MALDLAAESAALEREFAALIESFEPEHRKASLTLLKRCGIGTSSEMNWNARFKPLTLLYPLMEAEGLGFGDLALARRVTLAHECLIVYGFLDDRLRDNQMQFHPVEIDFMQRLVVAAVERLLPEGATSVPADLDEAVRGAMEAYRASQSARYAPAGAPAPDLGAAAVRRLLGDRALYGYISTIALARLAGAAAEKVAALREAFDWIALALQWVDDVQDLGEDLAVGEENLVLTLARACGVDAAVALRAGMPAAAVARQVAASGALLGAARAARGAFAAAAELHRGLGNFQLAGMIGERVGIMERLESAAAGLAPPAA